MDDRPYDVNVYEMRIARERYIDNAQLRLFLRRADEALPPAEARRSRNV
jgi:hypothetical protein